MRKVDWTAQVTAGSTVPSWARGSRTAARALQARHVRERCGGQADDVEDEERRRSCRAPPASAGSAATQPVARPSASSRGDAQRARPRCRRRGRRRSSGSTLPGVGLDLEVAASPCGPPTQRVERGRAGRSRGGASGGAGRRAAARGSGPATGASVGQRPSPSSASGRSSAPPTPAAAGLAGLVQEAGLDEGGEGVAASRGRRVLGVQGRRGLHLDDGEAGVGEPRRSALGGSSKRGGEVAGVDADADAARGRGRGERAATASVVGLDDAAGLGLEARSGSCGRCRPPSAAQAVARSELQRAAGAVGVAVGDPRAAPAERQGRDAASVGVVGQQAASTRRAVEGVVEPRRRVGPVRPVDAVLDHLGVEALVREAVEGDAPRGRRRSSRVAQPLAGRPGRSASRCGGRRRAARGRRRAGRGRAGARTGPA